MFHGEIVLEWIAILLDFVSCVQATSNKTEGRCSKAILPFSGSPVSVFVLSMRNAGCVECLSFKSVLKDLTGRLLGVCFSSKMVKSIGLFMQPEPASISRAMFHKTHRASSDAVKEGSHEVKKAGRQEGRQEGRKDIGKDTKIRMKRTKKVNQ